MTQGTSDFNSLLKSYSKFGTQSKLVILEKAIAQIASILNTLNTIDRQLISDLFHSEKVAIQNRQEMFKKLASDATNTELQQWLPCVKGADFLEIFVENKRPRFENNAWNKSLLEIFKTKQLIKEYRLTEDGKMFTFSRWGKNGLKND